MHHTHVDASSKRHAIVFDLKRTASPVLRQLILLRLSLKPFTARSSRKTVESDHPAALHGTCMKFMRRAA
jgi:hypothetical protein